MMLLSNKKYDALVQLLTRIENKLDAKKAAEKPRGGAELNGTHKNLPLSAALREVMRDGAMRDVGQARFAVQRSGLCKHPVNKQSVNALLSRGFLSGELTRPKMGHYQYKG